MRVQAWLLRRELENEKSPSPTKRMRSVAEKGTGGDGGFAPFTGLRREDRDFVFALEVFRYGLFELNAFTLALLALPIVRVRVVGSLRRGDGLDSAAKPPRLAKTFNLSETKNPLSRGCPQSYKQSWLAMLPR